MVRPGASLQLECPHPGDGKRFHDGVLCCADCCGGEPVPQMGAAVAGTPRRIQHDIPRQDMVKASAPVDTAAVRLQGWLDRQVLIGGVTPAERAVVERAIEDLRG